MKEELKPLTSLRFVAALAIVFHHLSGVMWIPAGYFHPFPLGSAVAFFFVLSGFVLHYSYGSRLSDIGWAAFSIQRLMRIWPVHLAVIALSAIWIQIPLIQFQTERQSFIEIVQVLFLLQAWNQKAIVFWGLNGPSWSISVELFFYVMFPWLLILLYKFGISVFLLIMLFLSILWLWLATQLLFDPTREFNVLALGYIFPVARIGEFAVGMALSAIMSGRLYTLRSISAWFWTILEFSIIAVTIFSLARLSSMSSAVQGFGAGPVFGQWVSSSGGFFAFALTIAVFAVGKGVVSRALMHPTFVWLGKVSFSTYLIHQPLMHHWARDIAPAQPSLFFEVVCYFLILILLSALLHKYIELPRVKFGRRASKLFLDKKQYPSGGG